MAICTSIADRSLIAASIHHGYSDYFVRPIEIDLFKERISKLMEKVPTIDHRYFKKVDEQACMEIPVLITGVSEFEI